MLSESSAQKLEQFCMRVAGDKQQALCGNQLLFMTKTLDCHHNGMPTGVTTIRATPEQQTTCVQLHGYRYVNEQSRNRTIKGIAYSTFKDW